TPSSGTIPYTDSGWAEYEAERIRYYDQMNTARREAQRKEHATYWDGRRKTAQEWLKSTPEVPVPALVAGYQAHNTVDHFLAEKLAKANAEAKEAERGTVDFYKDVKPILETKCYDCHAGTKVK